MDGDPSGKSRVSAPGATHAAIEFVDLQSHLLHDQTHGLRWFVSLFAFGADSTTQPLRQHGVQRRADQVALHAHVDNACDRAAGIVGVQRAEDQVAGKCRLNGDARCFRIPDFTDHQDVGILPQQAAQDAGERQADAVIHLELIDQLQLEFDRIFDRANVLFNGADGIERGIQCRALAAACWSGHQDDAVGAIDILLESFQVFAAESKLRQCQRDVAVVQDSDHGLFTVSHRQRADSQIDGTAFHHHVDAAVLGQPTLADVQRRHDLDARCHCRCDVAGQFQRLVKRSIDAEPDTDLPFRRLDVDVAGPLLDRRVDDVIDQPNDRTLTGQFIDADDVVDRLFDQLDGIPLHIVDDVVDDEDLRVGQVGLQRAADVARRGDCQLNFTVGDSLQSIQQEHVRRFGDGDRQCVSNLEQRKNDVLFDEFPRQQFHDLGVEQPRVQADEWQLELDGQAFQNLFFGAEFPVDQQFPQQFGLITFLLQPQRLLQPLGREKAAAHQQIAQSRPCLLRRSDRRR